jgi:hypothetical protein
LDGAGFGDLRRLIPSALPRGYGGEQLGGSYDFRWFGYTSAACAGLAGVIALMLAVNPRLAPAEIKALLRASSGAARAHSTDRAGPATGGPSCVDAARAVEAAELFSARPRQ